MTPLSRSLRVAWPAVHQPARLALAAPGIRELVQASLLSERDLNAHPEILA